MLLDRTAKYYRDHPTARNRHQEYQAQFDKKSSQVKKRSETNDLASGRIAIVGKDNKQNNFKK